VKEIADAVGRNAAADAAIVRVLGAEQEALRSISRARAETDDIAEQARQSARLTTERAERRIRCVTQAFERDLAARLAAIDVEAAALDRAAPLGADARAQLQAAVAALARQLAGLSP
jgi:vacuolar-type H+-ATPase subunit H